MAILSAEELQKRLLEGYDPDYHRSIYRQMNYAFGEPWNKSGPTGDLVSGDLPDWADITVRFQEVGRSRRILNTSLLSLSALMGNEIAPEFTQIDKQTAEGRKQFYLERYRGDDYDVDGAWGEQYEAAFLEGDGLGVGFLRWGVRTNPRSGFQRVTCQHSPTIYTLWDRHQRSPARSRWVAFVDHVAVEDAVAEYGSKIEQYARTMLDSQTSNEFRCVRLITYYDIGYGNKMPAMAVIPDKLTNEPIAGTLSDNVFECIPMSYMLHFVAPGMRRPIGRIALQMSTQEMVNELERYLKNILRKGPGVDIANMQMLEEADVKKRNAGDTGVTLRTKKPPSVQGEVPWTRIPGMELPAAWIQGFNIYDRQFSSDSGTTEQERGQMANERRTATEFALIDQRSQAGKTWSRKQTLLFMIRNVNMAMKIAAKFDRDPVTIPWNGFNITINDPRRPNTAIANWCKEPSRPIITPDALDAQDTRMKKGERLQDLGALMPFVQAGILPALKAAEETLDAIGEDEGEWLPPTSQVGAQGQPVAGQPGVDPAAAAAAEAVA